MVDTLNLFPQGLASGEAFYDREQEREKLRGHFLNSEHTVIVAPRRYGKTSLIKQALLDVHIPGKRIDLLPATNILFVEKAIRACFIELVNQIMPKTKQVREKLIAFIRELHPKLMLNFFGQKLEITATQSPEGSVIDLLDGLNSITRKINKRVVICFDEFQQLGFLKDHLSIEAAIRHAVEDSTHVTYVFSGSNRHLLNQMFSNKSKPLYHLCDLLELGRIPVEIYVPILLKRAVQKWGKTVNEKVVLEIINLTKCHPYYVNALCRQLWKIKDMPSVHSVQRAWLDYIETQSNWITDDLVRLTPNQRNILAALAYQPTSEPSGNEFSDRVKIGASSVKKSLSILVKNDFVYKDKDRLYKVLDPAIEGFLHQTRYFDFLKD